MKTIKFNRLDYANPIENSRGLRMLPPLNNVNDIEDENEISSLSFYTTHEDEAKAFAAKFPKSFKVRLAYVVNFDFPNDMAWRVYKQFNTFWTNKATGEVNETAVKCRSRMIKEAKKLFN